ncbi:MAG: NAD-dependent succinate-semialdehyde dehydrogenase [Alphaproteobacteria bacterium]
MALDSKAHEGTSGTDGGADGGTDGGYGISRLIRPELARSGGYIDGEWIELGSRFGVCNPATGEVLLEVSDCGEGEARAAVLAADRAWRSWRRETAGYRAEILRSWVGKVRENAEDLAILITLEQGKPLAESRGEVAYGVSYIEWYAEEARRTYGEVIPSYSRDRRIFALRESVGVVGAITPWNFPNALLARKVAPALAAGCTFVSKPAHETPLSALALAFLGEEAGIPGGVFNVVPTRDARKIGAVLTGDPLVRKFSFTGSTEVGKILLSQCAGTVKKTSMELGGNAPFIVFDDADLELAVGGLLQSKFRNMGQTCVCANRILVQDGIHNAFVSALVSRVEALRLGNGMDAGVSQGPLINAEGVEKVEAHLGDALAGGAEVVTGGGIHSSLGGTFYNPTVLLGAGRGMRFMREETFGPLAGVVRFGDEAEALALANDTPLGLAAYAYTRDLGRAWRLAEGLESGIVGLNSGVISSEVAPFGGIKESGLGREGGRHGLEEYLEVKYVNLAGLEGG